MTCKDYLDRACIGGVFRGPGPHSGRRRAAWFDDYPRRIIEHDAPGISGLKRLGELLLLLRLLAARNAGELSVADLAIDSQGTSRSLWSSMLCRSILRIRRLPSRYSTAQVMECGCVHDRSGS
jgi:hypothetical protein